MNTLDRFPQAPELVISEWFNSTGPITLASLRGKVVVIEAFQMLCPGCVSHGLPQAQQIHDVFPREQVTVLGLHSVFEHHQAMTPVSLKAFIHEYGLQFPIGVDQPGANTIPQTMEAYSLRGTPSLIVIDQQGRLRANHFGHVGDMQVAKQIAELVYSGSVSTADHTEPPDVDTSCDPTGCTANPVDS